jgi:hypothetical protein
MILFSISNHKFTCTAAINVSGSSKIETVLSLLPVNRKESIDPSDFKSGLKSFLSPQQVFKNGRKAIATNSLSIEGSVASRSLVG